MGQKMSQGVAPGEAKLSKVLMFTPQGPRSTVAGSGGLGGCTSGLWESMGKYQINGNQWESWEKNKTKTMEISRRRLNHIANLSWLHVATTAGVPNLRVRSRLISVRHSYKLHWSKS